MQDGRRRKPKKNGPEPVFKPKGPDAIQIIMSDNWKQQALVKKNSMYTPLTTMMLLLQMFSTVGMGAFAMHEVSFEAFNSVHDSN